MTGRNRRNELAIYAISFVSMVSVTVAPALALIAKEYIWASSTQIQLMVTLPSLAMVPAAFVSPQILKRFSIKSMYMLNLCITLVMGVAPFWLQDFYLILLTRAVTGFSLGFIQILLSVTITTRFPIEEQSRVMGGRNIATSFGAILISYIGGVLADMGWRMAFLPFFTAIPIILITMFGLNRMDPLPEDRNVPSERNDKRKRIDSVTVFICVATVIHVIFLQCFVTNISLFVDQEQIGTTVISGLGMAIFNFSGLVCGFVLARMHSRMKGKSLFVGFLSSAVGLSLIGLSVGMPMVFAGAFFSGFGMSSLLGIGPLDITGTIPRERASMGISWFAIAVFLGSFVTPYVVNPLTNLFRHDSIRTRFIVSGAMLFVQSVLYETIRRRYFSAYYHKMESGQFGGETAASANSGNRLSVPDEAAGALGGTPADQADTS